MDGLLGHEELAVIVAHQDAGLFSMVLALYLLQECCHPQDVTILQIHDSMMVQDKNCYISVQNALLWAEAMS